MLLISILNELNTSQLPIGVLEFHMILIDLNSLLLNSFLCVNMSLNTS